MNKPTSTHPLYTAATEARSLVSRGLTGCAIKTIEKAVADNGGKGLIAARLAEIAADYGRLVDSVVSGQEDDARGEVLDTINRRLLDLVTMIEHVVLSKDMPTVYFSTVRYLRRNKSIDFPTLHARLRKACDANDGSLPAMREVESAGRELFYRLWTGFPLSESAVNEADVIIRNVDYPLWLRCQLVSALMLGELEYHDERRMVLMLELYMNVPERSVALRALCGVLLSLWRHRGRQVSGKVASMLTLITDDPARSADVITAYKQFIRTRDTERISRKMTDEVIPEMLKLRPDIERLSKLQPGEEELLIDENPHWEEMLDRSGLKDRLRELSEMQQDGSDVFMTTFSNLKNFPFFNELSNWFLPFTPDYSEFAADETLKPIMSVLSAAPVLCDNDKYSMAFAMGRLGAAQRSMMADRMNVESLQMQEAMAAETLPDGKLDENYLNKYVQDLYRFYKLYPRAAEMHNPFDDSVNLVSLPSLKGVFNDMETLSLVGEFYFRRRYFKDALDVFLQLEKLSGPSLDLYQKIGHCLRQTGNNALALDYLLKADLIDGEDCWTLRHAGACCAALGDWQKARELYTRALAVNDSDMRIYNALIGIDIELKEYSRALTTLMALSLKERQLPPALRAREARLYMLTGDFAEAIVSYRQLEDSGYSLTGADIVSRGHAEWHAGLREDALQSWQKGLQMSPYKDMPLAEAVERVLQDADESVMTIDPVTRHVVTDILTNH